MATPTLRYRKFARDWSMVGKPPPPLPPIMLPRSLYLIARANGVDMRGYVVQIPIPQQPATSLHESPTSQATEIAPTSV